METDLFRRERAGLMFPMKITFVRPNLWAGRSHDAMEPLVFAILRGLTPPDIDCVLYDERIEPVPIDEPTDLVALTVETFTAKRAYQIAARYLSRGIPVVMGGYHPTLCPDEALRYATSIVKGDAEGAWPQVIEDARTGELRRVYDSSFTTLDGSVRDRRIFGKKKYKPLRLVEFGRGCRFVCDFCSIHAFYGANRRRRPVQEVVDEIRILGGGHVFFTDDNLFNDRDALRELLTALVPLRIRWSCQVSLDVAEEEELVALMSRAGCTSVTIGFESLIEGNLRQMRKLWNQRHGSYEDLVKLFHHYGIMVYGGFVLGYDHDTRDSFDITLDFALRSKLFLANFNPLAPTPGSRTYDRLRAEGRLINDPWWLHPDFRYGQAMFHPRLMSANELMEGCYWARTRFNRYSNICRRALDFRAHLRSPRNAAIFFAANLTNRRAVHDKQGRALGDGGYALPVFEKNKP